MNKNGLSGNNILGITAQKGIFGSSTPMALTGMIKRNLNWEYITSNFCRNSDWKTFIMLSGAISFPTEDWGTFAFWIKIFELRPKPANG